MALSGSPENSRNDVPHAPPFTHVSHVGGSPYFAYHAGKYSKLAGGDHATGLSNSDQSEPGRVGDSPEAIDAANTDPAIQSPADDVRRKLMRALL